MAEMNLRQITDRLNDEFTGSVRKLVFWYDEHAEFKDDIDTLELDNAKVLHLNENNQFYIKHFLECEDKTTNYLVYAPFNKPALKDNHLADTLRYSKEFFADRASLLTVDLGIDERFKPVIQHYIKFFANKERSQKFYDLEIEHYNRSIIEVALMSVLCKSKTASFEEVVRCILTDDGLENNKYLAEFEKYDLINSFWEHTNSAFGYQDTSPTLEKFVITLFVTYASKAIHTDVPTAWKQFVSYKSGNVITFMDNLMNSYLYADRFDEISEHIYKSINGETEFSKMKVEEIADCNIFKGIDSILVNWIIKRLENEDINAKLVEKTIPMLCDQRSKQHYGKFYKNEYAALASAWSILSGCTYTPESSSKKIIEQYIKTGYLNDSNYRNFYYSYDKIEDVSEFESLKDLVENAYTNGFLDKICVNWSREFVEDNADLGISKQKGFYDRYVKYIKERTVVIISDAMRYEVGQSLFEMLTNDEKCTVSIEPMQSVLPSYTRFGMSALLPHETLEMDADYQVLVDGKVCDSLAQREAVLKSYTPNAKCVQYDEIKNMKVNELRDIFTGQEVVYVYHNQIDARGDKLNTENEVFNACQEAIEEIYALIKRLSTSANTLHFIVTADHGFIYKRDKLNESDKIGNIASKKGSFSGKRYCISDKAVEEDGIASVPLGAILESDDSRMVSFPIGSDIFKVPGGGLNFVHGGCSPQEMLVPVIDVKTEKGHKDTSAAKIDLVSPVNKITNLIMQLDFIQTEPVSDVVKEATYRIYFISADGDKISNENIFHADKKDTQAADRLSKLRFTFKNMHYDRTDRYYLVAVDDKTEVEILRREIMMDIVFADDFGF